jgi:simple sugar transport system ATP-binding protein
MLNGTLKPTAGTVYYEGQEARFGSARHAVKKKIHTIYQNFALIDLFTVKENMKLIFPDKSDAELETMIAQYGKAVDLDERVALLPAGIKQRLEITKALGSDAKVLLMDEPTSVLAYEERDRLFKDLARLGKDKRLAILVATHKLQDVMDYCQQVVVLKGGKLVLQKQVSETNLKELTVAMFGASEELEQAPIAAKPAGETESVLDVKNLTVRGDNVPVAVRGATFSMHRGEILGIIAIAGNGQLELADAVYGLRKSLRGEVTPGQAILKSGRRLKIGRIAYASDDPIQTGLAVDLTVKDNFGVSLIDQTSKGFLVNWKALQDMSTRAIDNFEIKCYSIEEFLRELSGGNIQKVVVARELSRDVDVLVAVHPARGLDLHTTYLVYRSILEVARKGVSVLLISEDVDEALYLSDRLGAMYEGELSEVKPRGAWTRENLGAYMTGAHVMEAKM